MAHIRCTLRPHFTGQVGPVVFRNGHGETSDPDMLGYFADNGDEYDVLEDSLPDVPPLADDEDEPDEDADPDDLEDDTEDTDPED